MQIYANNENGCILKVCVLNVFSIVQNVIVVNKAKNRKSLHSDHDAYDTGYDVIVIYIGIHET